MRYLRLTILLTLALGPLPARAERDTFFLGTGRDGAFSASGPQVLINRYAKLTAPLATGDTHVDVDTTSGFAAGDLVLLHQSTGIDPAPPSGMPGPFELGDNPVGQWELARLASVSGRTLVLSQPLLHGYAAGVTQLIRVPEYTDVTIPAGSTLTAPAWNGSTGGVVAFLASGTVRLEGRISADGLGFRGSATTVSGDTWCAAYDGPGGAKGEGVVTGGAPAGYGNLANGAGGGNCHNAGGGGGGHGGPGGNGGRSYFGDGKRDVGGRGGARLDYAMLDHLLFGGGGGAGHVNDDSHCKGGDGGGILFIRARKLEGSGTLSANGASAADIGNDGGCGGGAGGGISIRIASSACLAVEALGGNGSHLRAHEHGPGGGGGGGRLLLQGLTSCKALVSAGMAGTQWVKDSRFGEHYGAEPTASTLSSYAGNITSLPGPFAVPAAPQVTSPAEGSRLKRRRPTFSGTAPAKARVRLSLDGSEVGQVTASSSGAFALTVTRDLPDATYRLEASSQLQGVWSAPGNPVTFTVDTVAPLAPSVSSPKGDEVVGTARPTILGTAEPGALLTVFLDSVKKGTVSADGKGAWSYTPSTPLSQGRRTVSATATDLAGNTGPACAPRPFTVDTVAPLTPSVTSPSHEAVVPAVTPVFRGTAEPGAQVTVSLDDATGGNTTADGTGAWSFTPSIALSQGRHTVSARATDKAGNTGPSSTVLPFNVDTAAPAAPVVTSPAPNAVVPTATPLIRGTAEAGSTVKVYLDSTTTETAKVPADGTGAWSFTPPAALSQGRHTVSARATDKAGNTGPSSTALPFTVDMAAPSAPVVTSPAPNAVVPTATPLIRGTAEAGSTVKVYLDDSATEIAGVPVDGSGAWSFTTPAALSQGLHKVSARATDKAGNTGPTSTALSFTVDTAAPAAPVVQHPASGSTERANRPFISGTAEAASTVTVYLDGTPSPVGTVKADGSGNWSFIPPTAITNGTHTVRAKATDKAGNISDFSSPISFTVDTTSPSPPMVKEPVEGSTLPVARPTVRGTAEAGSTLTVYLDRAPVPAGTAKADGSGNWSFVLPTALEDGPHMVAADAADAAGNTSRLSLPHPFTVDTAAPLAPALVEPAEGAVVGTASPVLRGTAEAGSTILLTLNGSGSPWGTVPVNGSGDWSLTAPTALAEGPHILTAAVRDAAGHVGASTRRGFTVDTQAPGVPIVEFPVPGAVVATATPTLRGRAEPWSRLTLQLNGLPMLSTQADAAGHWVLTLAAGLSDGGHSVMATATDLAGHISPPSSPIEFTVDTLAPLPPVAMLPFQGSTLKDVMPLFMGASEPASEVRVYVDGLLAGRTTTGEGGVWFFWLSTALNPGAHTASSVAVDAAGNTSTPSAPLGFTVDLEAPRVPAIETPVAHEVRGSGVLTFSGTAEPGSTVTVYLESKAAAPTARANASGMWSLTLNRALAEGSYEAQAVATDLAGNPSDHSIAIPFKVDLTPPLAPAVTAPGVEAQVGTGYPLIHGSTEPGARVLLFVDGIPAGQTQADSEGSWSLTPQWRLFDGRHSLDAMAEDAAGNLSGFTDVSPVWVDTATPPVPVLEQPADGSRVGTMRPTLSGRAEPGSTLLVLLDGEVRGTAVTNDWGAWRFTPDTPLPEGVHSFSAEARDGAGNTSPASRHTVFTVDTTPPGIPVLETPASGTRIGAGLFAFTGKAEPGSMVILFLDELMLGLAEADAAGRWSHLPSEPLGDGAHVVEAFAVDQAHNVGPLSAATSFSVDTVAPAAPEVELPASGAWVGTATPTLQGTAEGGATVEVFVEDVRVATARAGVDGRWSATTSPLPDGPHAFTVRVTDDTGLTGAPSAPRLVTLDTVPPDTGLVSGPEDVFYATTVTFAFSASEPGSGAECRLDGTDFMPCTSPVTLEGLALGTHTFEVRAKDVAGNVDPSPVLREWTLSSAYDGAGGGLGCGGCSAPGGAPGLALLGLLGLVRRAAARQREP